METYNNDMSKLVTLNGIDDQKLLDEITNSEIVVLDKSSKKRDRTEYLKKYTEENKDKIKQYQKEYRQKNKK